MPGPIDADRRDHAAVAPEHRDRRATTMRMFGIAVGEASRSARAIVALVALRVERAGGDERARGRAADPRIAMHHQRRRAIPGAHEAQQVADMRLGRRHVALDVIGDVVHVEQQVVFRRDRSAGRCTSDTSLISVTTWRAPVSRTVSCRRASEQTWIIESSNQSFGSHDALGTTLIMPQLFHQLGKPLQVARLRVLRRATASGNPVRASPERPAACRRSACASASPNPASRVASR